MKTHIMRWAPQDYRTCRVRARSTMSNDPMLRLVYLEALSALYEAGGSLPADASALSDELLLPAEQIARCLPILDEIARTGSGLGGLRVEDGLITNGRVTRDLIYEKEFRAHKAELGRRGGLARAGARLAKAKRSVSPPSPSPSPPKTDNPPNPPATAGGNGAARQPHGRDTNGTDHAAKSVRAALRRVKVDAELARQFAIDAGEHPTTKHRKQFRKWLLAGWTLEQVKDAIQHREHMTPLRI